MSEAVGDRSRSDEEGDGSDLGPAATTLPDIQGDADASLAATQMLSIVSPTGDDVSIYQLKWIEWGGEGKFSPIIVQNENGPCPLIALCNVLILRGRIKISPGQTDVSSTYLTDLLGTYVLECHKTNQLSDGEKANLEQNIQDAMAIFPKLQTGLDVNVKFNSVSGFEFTGETGVFDLVGVHLYHGWLADPQDNNIYRVVKDYSYNQLVEMVINNSSAEDPQKVEEALVGQQFLESTASQLTYHGIYELSAAVAEGELCVFFRNNHFNTLMKRKDILLTLVTDHGFVNEMGYVWQTLSDIDGGGDFLDASFNLSPHSQTQQNRERAVPGNNNNAGTSIERTEGEKEGEGEKDTEEVISQAINQDLDYQTALRLQEEEYDTRESQQRKQQQQEEEQQQQQQQQQQQGEQGEDQPSQTLQQELMDLEFAAQLQQEEDMAAVTPSHQSTPPPNTAEEYERIALAEHRESSHKTSCILF